MIWVCLQGSIMLEVKTKCVDQHYAFNFTIGNINQRTNGPVNAHLRSAAYTNKHV